MEAYLTVCSKFCFPARFRPAERRKQTQRWFKGNLMGKFVLARVRLAVCVLLLGASTGLGFAEPARAEEPAKNENYYELMQVFVDTFEQIDRNYVKDVDRKKLMQAAIRGMLDELDPYSSYIDPDQLTKFNQDVDQEFGGIGIQVQIDPETKRITVISPLPGTPAYKAGVKAGDVLMEIEGQSTKDFQIEDAVKLLKGPPGDEVTIGVMHQGESEIRRLKMKRDIIQVATVLGDKYKDNDDWDYLIDPKEKIGYIRLTHFSRRSGDELIGALRELQDQGMRGLVLDLRFNPGGLLSQAVRICDLFVDQGRIVSTKGRNTDEQIWDAHRSGTFNGFPMAVLVNRYSASASEIVSACLQDHERAKVVGERTWGKGSVQTVIEMEGGSSALKLTTASYHRPSGKNIHRFPNAKETDDWGVVPDEDYKVEFSTKQLRDYLDYRRDRDVLGSEGPPKSEFEDAQLSKALEYLRNELNGNKPQTTEKTDKNKEEKAQPAEAGKAAAQLERKPLRVPMQLVF
jgi:carboxyl-terminal processing protease